MRSLDRQLSIALLVALVATAGATAQEPSLAGLTGSWRSPSQGVAGGQTGERVETTGKLVLDGQWLELEVRTISDDGPRSGDRLMLRQQADGSVIAYVFSADQESATRLKGGWSPQGALELAGAGSDTGFVWSTSSECRANLTRAAEVTLHRAGCSPKGRLLAQGPEVDAADDEPLAAEDHTAASSPQDAPAAEPEAPAPLAEVEVAALPAARAPAPARGSESTLVIMAGNGKPYDEVKKAVDRLIGFLTERGVDVAGPSDDIVVLQAAQNSLAYLLRQIADRDAASLLYVTAAFGGRERVIVDCYNADGLAIWREKIVGGTGMRKFQWVNPKLMERIEERLLARIGGPGLPVSSTPTAPPAGP